MLSRLLCIHAQSICPLPKGAIAILCICTLLGSYLQSRHLSALLTLLGWGANEPKTREACFCSFYSKHLSYASDVLHSTLLKENVVTDQ